jgi:hypothetical protein
MPGRVWPSVQCLHGWAYVPRNLRLMEAASSSALVCTPLTPSPTGLSAPLPDIGCSPPAVAWACGTRLPAPACSGGSPSQVHQCMVHAWGAAGSWDTWRKPPCQHDAALHHPHLDSHLRAPLQVLCDMAASRLSAHVDQCGSVTHPGGPAPLPMLCSQPRAPLSLAAVPYRGMRPVSCGSCIEVHAMGYGVVPHKKAAMSQQQ